jgi:hypothetical protein
MFVLAAIGFASAFFFPGGPAGQHAYKAESSEEVADGELAVEPLAHIG